MALRWVIETRKERLGKSGTNGTQDWSRDGEQVIWGPGGRLYGLLLNCTGENTTRTL